MVKRYLYILYTGIVVTAIIGSLYLSHTSKPTVSNPVIYGGTEVTLPQPRLDGETSVEEAIHRRRSIREYSQEPLSLEDVSQLLWSSQGITGPQGFRRTAPSAGGTYPLEVYLVAGKVEGLDSGVYHYNPKKHSMTRIKNGDFREKLQEAGLNQEWIGQAAVSLVFTAVYERTMQVYGERGVRYVHLEAGHTAQNVYLQAVSLNMGTVTVGAFDDKKVLEVLNATREEIPLYIMPVGKL